MADTSSGALLEVRCCGENSSECDGYSRHRASKWKKLIPYDIVDDGV